MVYQRFPLPTDLFLWQKAWHSWKLGGKPQVNGLALTYHSSPTTGRCSCWIWLTAINQPNCRHLGRYQLEKAWGRMWAEKQHGTLFLMGWCCLGNSYVFCIWQLEALFCLPFTPLICICFLPKAKGNSAAVLGLKKKQSCLSENCNNMSKYSLLPSFVSKVWSKMPLLFYQITKVSKLNCGSSPFNLINAWKKSL